MDYFVIEDVKVAIEEGLGKLTSKEWCAIVVMLEITVPFHMTDEDLDYDIPRCKRLLELIKIDPP